MIESTKILHLRKCEQGTSEWHNAKRFRISSGSAAACLKPSVKIMEISDNEANFYGISINFDYELAIKLAFFDQIIDTGLWICAQSPWLCSSPDGFILLDNELVVVEIKAIKAEKDAHAVLVEYYVQVQLEMFVTSCNKALLIIFFRNTLQLQMLLVERDDKYITNVLYQLEKKYFSELIGELCANNIDEMVEKMLKYEHFLEKYMQFSHALGARHNTASKKPKKALIYKQIKLEINHIFNSSKLSFKKIIQKKNEAQQRSLKNKLSDTAAVTKVTIPHFGIERAKRCLNEVLKALSLEEIS